MKNDIIYQLWSEFINNIKYKKYFISNEDEWIETLNQVQEYIDENNKRPSTVDKNKQIKTLGNWISTQIKNYKNKEKIMKNDDICKLWNQFINHTKYIQYFISNEEAWINTLNEIKVYINENNKRPSIADKIKKIKSLGMWISHQLQNYKNKVKIMKNDIIYNIWMDFIKEYNKYFYIKL